MNEKIDACYLGLLTNSPFSMGKLKELEKTLFCHKEMSKC